MGNLCSRSSNTDDNFTGQGRIVGGPSPQPASAPIPPKITTNSPGRPLGGAGGGSNSSSNGGLGVDGPLDPKTAAAKAAEERAKAASRGTSGGPLSAKLAAERKQTRNELLNAGSKAEQQARDADAAAATRTWN